MINTRSHRNKERAGLDWGENEQKRGTWPGWGRVGEWGIDTRTGFLEIAPDLWPINSLSLIFKTWLKVPTSLDSCYDLMKWFT